jgi:hypothetical protein
MNDLIPEPYGYDILDWKIDHLQDELFEARLYADKLEDFLDALARNTDDITFKMKIENLLRMNPYE